MQRNTFSIRQLDLPDSDAVAMISRISRHHFLPYLPDLHSLQEDQAFFRHHVFQQYTVWGAEQNGALVGFCAYKVGWLDHLYLLPDHVGKSIGTALLNKAKAHQDRLQLWVFQQNTRAIDFYQRHGFSLHKETDGAANEEKTPDALYVWRA